VPRLHLPAKGGASSRGEMLTYHQGTLRFRLETHRHPEPGAAPARSLPGWNEQPHRRTPALCRGSFVMARCAYQPPRALPGTGTFGPCAYACRNARMHREAPANAPGLFRERHCASASRGIATLNREIRPLARCQDGTSSRIKGPRPCAGVLSLWDAALTSHPAPRLEPGSSAQALRRGGLGSYEKGVATKRDIAHFDEDA